MKRAAVTWLLLAACHEPPAPPAPAPERFGLGRAATSAEIAALDDDVQPDGTGLPPGRGTVAEGAPIYAAHCASCHGPTGREGPVGVLVGAGQPLGYRVGRRPSTATPATVGNLYPYATTLYDYIHRTMPWAQPGSLEPDEVYSLVAWLLHQNDIVPVGVVLDATTLPKIEMPAHGRFIEDSRRGR
jgi:cytochrome c